MHQKPGLLDRDLAVSTLLGECVIVQTVFRDCSLQINLVEFPADLIIFPLLELDVILGMDWLTRHRAIVNCYTKEVIFEIPGQDKVIFCEERQAAPGCLVSAMTAFRLIQEGCQTCNILVLETLIDTRVHIYGLKGLRGYKRIH